MNRTKTTHLGIVVALAAAGRHDAASFCNAHTFCQGRHKKRATLATAPARRRGPPVFPASWRGWRVRRPHVHPPRRQGRSWRQRRVRWRRGGVEASAGSRHCFAAGRERSRRRRQIGAGRGRGLGRSENDGAGPSSSRRGDGTVFSAIRRPRIGD